MLKGKRINLRTIRKKDLEALLELSSDVEARGDYYPLNLPTESGLQARFDKDGMWSEDSGTMLIVDKESDRILGSIVFFRPVHYYDCVEIGYMIYRPQDRGKGLMEEALRLFTRYLFAWKAIHRIQIQAQPPNVASRRVAEKCGFKYEGTARQAFISNGVPVDIDVFSILRSECEE